MSRLTACLMILILPTLFACSDATDPADDNSAVESAERGTWQETKADEDASCQNHCGVGGPTADGCFCDQGCSSYGDCCPDFVQLCTDGAEVETCGIECQQQSDCPASEPYCNVDTGTCQRTSPGCVSDADCSDDTPFCHSSGYCHFFPELNCRPGEVVFEGQCDNPSCEPETCPDGTVLDDTTCACEPTSSAPSCQVQHDCNAAYPYCNYDTGTCQQAPVECTNDADCASDGGFCQSTGYCGPWNDFNCDAGDVVFEGECDNPACDQAACPEGTLLDESTCDCAPICG